MTENKLKPCPFCGGEAYIDVYDDKLYARCHACESMTALYDDIQEAIDAWNTRADEHWISVKDALPKTRHKKTIDDCVYYDSDPVAVVTVDDIGDRSIGVGIYYVGREDGKLVSAWDGFTVEDIGLYNCTVTHWRPLPKLPEVEK